MIAMDVSLTQHKCVFVKIQQRELPFCARHLYLQTKWFFYVLATF